VEGRLSRPKPGPAENFEQLGEECSFTERRAERAERMATRLRLLRYLQDHRGRVCRGQVTGVSPLGLFLRLDFVPVEGLLRLGSLAGGRYGFDADTQSLVGRRSGERLQLGDWLTVRIARIDVRRRTLELTPAGDEEATQVGQAPTTQRRGGKRAGEGGRQPRDTGGKGRDGRAGSVEVAGDAGDAGGGAALGHRRKKTGGGSSRRRKPITPKHRRRKGTDRGPRGGRSRR
jgi:ribonuclease R